MSLPASPVPYTVVIPTVGRPSLAVLLDALHTGHGPRPAEILVVDDRPGSAAGPPGPTLEVPAGVRLLPSGGRGPAAARNIGWRAARSEWVAFLDDDVVTPADWPERLVADIA